MMRLDLPEKLKRHASTIERFALPCISFALVPSTDSISPGAQAVNTLMERFGELGTQVGRFAVDMRDYWGKGAEAGEMVGRALSFATTLAKVEVKAFEIADIQRARSEINDSMGDQARSLEEVRKEHKKHVDEYLEERRKLEAMSK